MDYAGARSDSPPMKFPGLVRALGTALLCGLVWGASRAAGADSSTPAPSASDGAFESYLARPDSLHVTPRAHPELGGADWEKLKRAHLEAVAMLLEMYPDREIYFLARDAELLYDLSRRLTHGDPRLHLLNVSRANEKAAHLRDYLVQEGVSEEALRAGKKILFVDTGFEGSIPRALIHLFPANLRAQMQTQLMASAESTIPSSRAFLSALNPAAPVTHPGGMRGSMLAYENMPRYTATSSFYARVNGRWTPMSRVASEWDDRVSKAKATHYIEDLLAYAQAEPPARLFAERCAVWKQLHAWVQDPGLSVEALRGDLRAMLAAHPGDPFTEAMVRDFLDLKRTNFPGGANVGVRDLGLEPVFENTSSESNKKFLIRKYPEWAAVLQDPEGQIPRMIRKADFSQLGAIVDVIHDSDFMRSLCQALGREPLSPAGRRFIQMLIQQDPDGARYWIATETFSGPRGADLKAELGALIPRADQETLRELVLRTFPSPSMAGMDGELKQVLGRLDPDELDLVPHKVFTQPHAAQFKSSLQFMIAQANEWGLDEIAKSFANPHMEAHVGLFPELLARAPASALQIIRNGVFFGRVLAEARVRVVAGGGEDRRSGSTPRISGAAPRASGVH